MHALVEAGADIIELGVPFSDPMADGPVIQRASERALKHHVSLQDVIDMVRDFRRTNAHTPVVLMGYLNPLEVMGYAAFAEAASAAGVDGVLTVDIPPEEGEVFVPAMKAWGIDPIFLLAPTSNRARIERITAAASGFVYYVSLKGVTGAANLSLDSVREKLAEIRSCTDLPVGVGFGIRMRRPRRQWHGLPTPSSSAAPWYRALRPTSVSRRPRSTRSGLCSARCAPRWTQVEQGDLLEFRQARNGDTHELVRKLMPSRIRTEGGNKRPCRRVCGQVSQLQCCSLPRGDGAQHGGLPQVWTP